MPTVDTTKRTTPAIDPHLQSAAERVKTAAEELRRRGIADKTGRRIRKDMPSDMREGSEHDFGG